MFSTTICGRPARPAPYAASSRSIARNCSSTSSVTSITCRNSRARSRCARNSSPRPIPSLAPSTRPGTSATVSCRPSPASTVPSTGASVVNGYSATFGFAFEIRRRSDDLPAFGKPSSAASASSFRRSSYVPSSPACPTSASARRLLGRRREALVPHARRDRRAPAAPARPDARGRRRAGPSSSKTCVPTGTCSSIDVALRRRACSRPRRAARASPRSACLRGEEAQVAPVGIRDEHDVAALAAVTAVGAALRDVLLPAEAQAAVPAPAALHVDARAVVEHGRRRLDDRDGAARGRRRGTRRGRRAWRRSCGRGRDRCRRRRGSACRAGGRRSSPP